MSAVISVIREALNQLLSEDYVKEKVRETLLEVHDAFETITPYYNDVDIIKLLQDSVNQLVFKLRHNNTNII